MLITDNAEQFKKISKALQQSGIGLADAVGYFKRNFIASALEGAAGNQCRAAKVLLVHRNTLSRAMSDLSLYAIRDEIVAKRKRPNGRLPAEHSFARSVTA